MRTLFVAVACTLLVSGCTSGGDRSFDAIASTEQTQNVITYDVAPPNAISLGPVTVTACNGTRDVAVRRIVTAAGGKGGNGITQLACHDQGMSFYCWSSVTCEASALNVPPPPPPPPVVKPRTRVKHPQPQMPQR